MTRRHSAPLLGESHVPQYHLPYRGFPRPEPVGRGVFAVQGAGVTMIPSRADGFLTTPEAARLVGVQPVTIRKWRRLGRLTDQGRDEKGYPLYTPQAVRNAEQEVRENGLKASKIDPRQLRLSALKRAA